MIAVINILLCFCFGLFQQKQPKDQAD